MGGKSKLADTIIAKFPAHRCYVEPFCGGAAIFLKKHRSKVEVINDINNDLVNFYICVQNHPDELFRQVSLMLHSRFMFNRIKLLSGQTDLQRAAIFYAINRMSFGGKMHSNNFGYARTSSSGFSVKRFFRDVAIVSKRLDGCYIESSSWDDCVKRYDSKETLFYLDPPYYKTAGYGVDFAFSEYEKMAILAKSIDGKMFISINDHDAIRMVFDGLSFDQLKISYSLKKVCSGGARAPSKELLVYNF